VYAAVRPGYPERVYEILRDRCRLGRASRVLEIGSGTGQATKRLAQLAGSLVSVEPNAALAAQLLTSVSPDHGHEIVIAPFEDVSLPVGSFDLVAVATAFHWLDPAVALPKIRTLLRPRGWLGVWWNVFGDPSLPDPFHEATEPTLRHLASSPGGGDYPLDVAARSRDLSEHGFDEVEHEAIKWTLRMDAQHTRGLYATYSHIARLPLAERDAVLDEIERIASLEFAGRVERQMITSIYTAHR
jgi:SAM-dependent methyltransferase